MISNSRLPRPPQHIRRGKARVIRQSDHAPDVSGPPGAGKSTLAPRLASALRLPLIAQDTIKEAMGDAMPVATVDESRRLGRACIAVMFAIAAAQLDVGVGAVVETPLVRGASDAEVTALARRSRVAIVHCRAEEPTLRARYKARIAAGTRHAVHMDAHRVSGDRMLAPSLYAPLDIGVPTLLVDTTDGYRPGLDEILAWATGPGT